MAELHLLPIRLHQDGMAHLARDLERTLSSGAPFGPHTAQICATALGLQQLCDELRRATDRMASELALAPEVEALCASLHGLADNFSRLATAAQNLRKLI